MDITNQTELELYFADHFDTVLFPVLADMYQSKADYTRAKRVCEIGLEHHPESVDGQFILSQAEMALGNFEIAAGIFEKINPQIDSSLYFYCSAYANFLRGEAANANQFVKKALDFNKDKKEYLELEAKIEASM